MAKYVIQDFLAGTISAIIIVIAGLALGPVVVDQVQDTNTTDWEFTGHEGVEALIDLFPLIYYAGIFLASMTVLFGLAYVSARGRR